MSDCKHELSMDDLQPDSKNANKGSDRGRALVEASLQECGAGRSVLADRDGVVIAGNKTLEAARRLGLPVRAVRTEGAELVVVQRSDLSLDEGDKARRLAYLDNRTSELGLQWDCEQLLADLQGGVDLSGIFERPELDALLAAVLQREGLCDPDLVPEVPDQPVSRLNDVWVMGDLGHRVGCGDATDAELVERVLAGGEPRLLVVDPPYGVQLDMEWRDRALLNGLGPAEHSYMRPAGISGDQVADWSAAFELVPSLEVAYVWHATAHMLEVAAGLARIGFELRQQIVWVKTALVISRSAYHWQHEPCWYAVRKGASAGWIGSRDQSTVWQLASPKALMGGSAEERYDHPTQKPLECMARPVANHTGEVYDCFLGSGTTLIACESLGRRCYGLEIDPRFSDVICQRWATYSGKQPVLEGDGRTFAEVAAERTSGNTPQGNATP